MILGNLAVVRAQILITRLSVFRLDPGPVLEPIAKLQACGQGKLQIL